MSGSELAEHAPFGSQIPFSEPPWYQGAATAHYDASHAKLRDRLRQFMDTKVLPNVGEWDELGGAPESLPREMFEAGVWGLWPVELGGTGVCEKDETESSEDEKWVREPDVFHRVIAIDEYARAGSGGFTAGVMGGMGIGLPPILRKGTPEMIEEVAKPCIRAEKKICLGITEPVLHLLSPCFSMPLSFSRPRSLVY
jgi:alkylation response protein AidB-like acyl-CoA dehydrogenase